jgi:hypothetical protein
MKLDLGVHRRSLRIREDDVTTVTTDGRARCHEVRCSGGRPT